MKCNLSTYLGHNNLLVSDDDMVIVIGYDNEFTIFLHEPRFGISQDEFCTFVKRASITVPYEKCKCRGRGRVTKNTLHKYIEYNIDEDAHQHTITVQSYELKFDFIGFGGGFWYSENFEGGR